MHGCWEQTFNIHSTSFNSIKSSNRCFADIASTISFGSKVAQGRVCMSTVLGKSCHTALAFSSWLWIVSKGFLKLGKASPFCGHLEFLWYISKILQDDEFSCALIWLCVAKTNQQKRCWCNVTEGKGLLHLHGGSTGTQSFKPQFWSIATCFQHLPVTFTTFALLCIRWMTTGTAFISFTMLQQKHREREK